MAKSRRFATAVLLSLRATEIVSFNSSINYKPTPVVRVAKNRHRTIRASAGASRQKTSPTPRSFVSPLSDSRHRLFGRGPATQLQSELSVHWRVTAENADPGNTFCRRSSSSALFIAAVGCADTKQSRPSFGTSMRATASSSSIESSTRLVSPTVATSQAPARLPSLLPSIGAPLLASISGRVPEQQQLWRPPATTTAATTVTAFTGHSSDPIERFSGKEHAGGASGGVPSLLRHLARDLHSRTHGGETQRNKRHLLHQGSTDEGLTELCSAISRVEVKLSTDSPEVEQLREALQQLRSEREAYSRERAAEVARIEAITREYDDLRRRAAITEAELSRSDRRIKSAETEREKARKALSDRVGQLSHRLGKEKESFARAMKAAETQGGGEGATAVGEITLAYRDRMRALSDGLGSTHQQLAVLKINSDKEKREANKTRDQLTAQVSQLEGQLQRAGQGVEHEKAEMEAVLLRLSNALSGVDIELTQSAGMTPSRETSRALRRAQEDFRKDQRGVKLLLEKQRQRYDKTSRVMEEEAQRLRARTNELNSLRAGLAESEGKERQLKSGISTLGSRLSTLDNELRRARDELSREQGLRRQAEAALLSAEQLREQETVNLRRELKATHENMATTRMVYEDTVEQRHSWRRMLTEEERAKQEADGRAETFEARLRDEIAKNKEAAVRREKEVADLKAQIVTTSRSLALSKTEMQGENQRLMKKIDKLTEEASRLEAQAEQGKRVVARTVTGVSSRAFRNASNISQTMAPQGLLTKLGDVLSERFRGPLVSTSSPPRPPPPPPTPPTLDRKGGATGRSRSAPPSAFFPDAAHRASTTTTSSAVAERAGRDKRRGTPPLSKASERRTRAKRANKKQGITGEEALLINGDGCEEGREGRKGGGGGGDSSGAESVLEKYGRVRAGGQAVVAGAGGGKNTSSEAVDRVGRRREYRPRSISDRVKDVLLDRNDAGPETRRTGSTILSPKNTERLAEWKRTVEAQQAAGAAGNKRGPASSWSGSSGKHVTLADVSAKQEAAKAAKEEAAKARRRSPSSPFWRQSPTTATPQTETTTSAGNTAAAAPASKSQRSPSINPDEEPSHDNPLDEVGGCDSPDSAATKALKRATCTLIDAVVGSDDGRSSTAKIDHTPRAGAENSTTVAATRGKKGRGSINGEGRVNGSHSHHHHRRSQKQRGALSGEHEHVWASVDVLHPSAGGSVNRVRTAGSTQSVGDGNKDGSRRDATNINDGETFAPLASVTASPWAIKRKNKHGVSGSAGNSASQAGGGTTRKATLKEEAVGATRRTDGAINGSGSRGNSNINETERILPGGLFTGGKKAKAVQSATAADVDIIDKATGSDAAEGVDPHYIGVGG